MSRFELKLPKMGESVAEATITSWLKEVGETIELDEAIVEIATDKVDSEVPSEVEGVLVERRFDVDDVVGVGQVIAVIETDGEIEAVATQGRHERRAAGRGGGGVDAQSGHHPAQGKPLDEAAAPQVDAGQRCFSECHEATLLSKDGKRPSRVQWE